MATKTIVEIGGKVGTNFCFEESLEKRYCCKFGAS
jgi:hypothetical protein